MRGDTQTKLAEYVRSQSEWRQAKADEYPGDHRNQRASNALALLADYLVALPSTDRHIMALAAIQEPYALDVFAPGEEGNRLISQYGFHETEDPDLFLERLVTAEVGDALEREIEDV